MKHRAPFLGLALLALLLHNPVVRAAPRPQLDALGASPPNDLARARVERLRNDPALTRLGTSASVDDRLGLPTFVWAGASADAGARVVTARLTSAQAARAHLARLAPLYRMDADDVAAATLREVHDTGRGGIVASFVQTVGGVAVFRDELKLLLSRDGNLIAASGYLPSRALSEAQPVFDLSMEKAIVVALRDHAGAAVAPSSLTRLDDRPGGYSAWRAPLAGFEPIRIRRVLFHLPDELRPAWHLELLDGAGGFAYVVSAADGAILLRHDLGASDAFAYRVWAEAGGLRLPHDGPHADATPHPSGTPIGFQPPFVPPVLVSLQNGPISTNDPWLPAEATETVGNNVDAYADLMLPDGRDAPTDFRATTTSPNAFDRAYDPTQDPALSTDQQMAAITQLFYTTNFLHDWFYDAGFGEVSRNAQFSNYGRGGIEGDRLRVEAQDYSGLNNANMLTPGDGGSPRMQMYVFASPSFAQVHVAAPAGLAGDHPAGYATAFGPQNFLVSGDVVLAADGVGSPTDACQALAGVAGRIVLVDRGSCGIPDKALNAQDAGAIGVIVVHNIPGAPPPSLTGTSTSVTVPVLSVTQELGNAMKSALLGGPVTVTLTRTTPTRRDGTIDNLTVAHEWGHYLSNRLIGNAAGLTTNQSRGMGEGWGDFVALLLAVREGDAAAGTYGGAAAYALGQDPTYPDAYYFGFRRFPYTTDFAKNALTFRHVADGEPLPPGPVNPIAAPNSEVHNTGEVWGAMLWECYAALIHSGGRLSFDEARSRMKSYLVASMKLTPNQPTFVEARDALRAAAYALDPADHDAFCEAFARRGIGLGAVAPDRFSTDNTPVLESYTCGPMLAFVSAEVTDVPGGCDQDGYLDEGENGRVVVTLRNVGGAPLNATAASVSSSLPAVSFPSGSAIAMPPSNPFQTVSAPLPIRLDGAVGSPTIDLDVAWSDPALGGSQPAPTTWAYANVDEVPSFLETFEERTTTCGSTGNPLIADHAWRRLQVAPADHRFFAPDPRIASDHALVTPPIAVSPIGTFSFTFRHRHAFDAVTSNYFDGGVIELTTNDGSTWTDLGGFATPAYGGTINPFNGNILAGRTAYVATNASWPALDPVTVNLGAVVQGKTVRIRFRLGADAATAAYGWEIDDLELHGAVSPPFLGLVADPTVCVVDAGEPLPGALAFAIDGANPARGEARFRFALPRAARVEIGLYDLAGRRVATLADGEYAAGVHTASWRAGRTAGAGVYFARLKADGRELRRRVVVLP